MKGYVLLLIKKWIEIKKESKSVKDLKAYDILCQNDGSFLEPERWPKCVSSMYYIINFQKPYKSLTTYYTIIPNYKLYICNA